MISIYFFVTYAENYGDFTETYGIAIAHTR